LKVAYFSKAAGRSPNPAIWAWRRCPGLSRGVLGGQRDGGGWKSSPGGPRPDNK